MITKSLGQTEAMLRLSSKTLGNKPFVESVYPEIIRVEGLLDIQPMSPHVTRQKHSSASFGGDDELDIILSDCYRIFCATNNAFIQA